MSAEAERLLRTLGAGKSGKAVVGGGRDGRGRLTAIAARIDLSCVDSASSAATKFTLIAFAKKEKKKGPSGNLSVQSALCKLFLESICHFNT